MPVLQQASDCLPRFCQGSLDAFEELFRRHQAEVFGWIVRIVRDPAAAEDLTLETFWRIYRGHARFDPSRSFGAWSRRIATNVAIDYLKTLRREVELPEDLPAADRMDTAVSEELRRKTAPAFRRLAPKLRVAATLALIEQQPYKEIAAALGITEAAVKVRIFRAIRILRKDLQRQGVKP